jgi:hypothetical protein
MDDCLNSPQDRIKAMAMDVRDAILRKRDSLNALPRLIELEPPDTLVRALKKKHQDFFSSVWRKAQKKSVLRNLATQIPIKAGRSYFSVGSTRTTLPTELKARNDSHVSADISN